MKQHNASNISVQYFLTNRQILIKNMLALLKINLKKMVLVGGSIEYNCTRTYSNIVAATHAR